MLLIIPTKDAVRILLTLSRNTAHELYSVWRNVFTDKFLPSSISLIKHFLPSSPAVATTKVYINGDTF